MWRDRATIVATMIRIFKSFAALLATTLIAGCATVTLPKLFPSKPESLPARISAPPSAPHPGNAAPPPPPGARTAATLDTTTPAQRAAALAAPNTGGAKSLGRVSVALGKVTEPGFWLRGALVTVAGKGRVVTPSGASVQVDLVPGTGAAQLSLAAFRALGFGLTDLPVVTVLAR
ncbi:MAG: D-galactarate dehydratase [Paracoccaceae bacterium]|nr:D-galactarate dehydratase [Paracoccaceae bacterium]